MSRYRVGILYSFTIVDFSETFLEFTLASPIIISAHCETSVKIKVKENVTLNFQPYVTMLVYGITYLRNDSRIFDTFFSLSR